MNTALKWYAFEQMKNIRYVEAFEMCEYGSMPDKIKIKQLFPGNLIVNKIYSVGHGYKQKGNLQIYISSGLGIRDRFSV